MKKLHKLIMVPTENEGAIMTEVGPFNTEMVAISNLPENLRTHDRPHNHLYILSNDKPEEGDWIVDYGFTHEYKVKQWVGDDAYAMDLQGKIIATTNKELGKWEGIQEEELVGKYFFRLPQIHKSIIDQYIRLKGKVDKVKVHYNDKDLTLFTNSANEVKIVIPI